MSKNISILMMGTGGVFLYGKFVETYDPTIEGKFFEIQTIDSYEKHVQVDGKDYTLNIIDLCGPEEYSAMRDQYMRCANGFLLVYSVTDPSSFEDCKNLYEQLLRSVDSDEVPLVLVGNKSDLVEERIISTSKGLELSEKFGNCKFIETSAKLNLNVESCYIELVRLFTNTFDEKIKVDEVSETKKTKPKVQNKGLFSSISSDFNVDDDIEIIKKSK